MRQEQEVQPRRVPGRRGLREAVRLLLGRQALPGWGRQEQQQQQRRRESQRPCEYLGGAALSGDAALVGLRIGTGYGAREMSERIELTRGDPNTDSPMDYSGADPLAALRVLKDGHIWFGLVKIWSDAPDLVEEFSVLLDQHHPGGREVITAIHPLRYAAWRR